MCEKDVNFERERERERESVEVVSHFPQDLIPRHHEPSHAHALTTANGITCSTQMSMTACASPSKQVMADQRTRRVGEELVVVGRPRLGGL